LNTKNEKMKYIKEVTKLVLFSIALVSFTSCIINDNIKDTSTLINPGNDPNFTIVVNTDNILIVKLLFLIFLFMPLVQLKMQS
jgi:hypothetical protein